MLYIIFPVLSISIETINERYKYFIYKWPQITRKYEINVYKNRTICFAGMLYVKLKL